jgi:hypothetical protein
MGNRREPAAWRHRAKRSPQSPLPLRAQAARRLIRSCRRRRPAAADGAGARREEANALLSWALPPRRPASEAYDQDRAPMSPAYLQLISGAQLILGRTVRIVA